MKFRFISYYYIITYLLLLLFIILFPLRSFDKMTALIIHRSICFTAIHLLVSIYVNDTKLIFSVLCCFVINSQLKNIVTSNNLFGRIFFCYYNCNE